jgi:uncharacterized protein (DUF885 family)
MKFSPAKLVTAAILVVALACGPLANSVALADDAKPRAAADTAAAYVPDLPPLMNATSSELREVVERFSSDRAALLRRYNVEYSPARRAELRDFYVAWQARLQAIDFEKLSADARIDYVLLQNRLRHEVVLLQREEKIWNETSALVPFATTIIDLQETRRRMESMDSAAAAAALAKLNEAIDKSRKAVEAGLRPEPKPEANPEAKEETKAPAKADKKTAAPAEAKSAAPPARAETKASEKPARENAVLKPTKTSAYRASLMLTSLRQTLEQWFKYYSGYDPLFTWWTSAPYKKTDESLKAYVKLLRERVLGVKEGDDEPIVGYPIGREELLADLASEMIAYSPEELVAIAEREFIWCEAEMKKASQAMGFGDDWKAALEKVKSLHVDPGKQPDLIRDLAIEATEYVEKHDLVTVPPLAKDIWRIEMMSPERQKESPFFLGGEVILVSYPTDTMSQEDKLMSMRGNNIHFARATVFHELIPGHHLQGFMTDRYNSHRRAFATPFWTEGWSLWWEMLLWDMGFPQTPENKVGMLFWRMHRCARIIFSLGFHLGTMTPQQCIDFLVDRVGHERANATAEVRRSFNGSYPPLYQIAYMMGALQFRALHTELVDSGKMTNREFHDAILQGGRIPVEMVRAMLTKQPPARDFTPSWKFAGTITLKK